MENIDLDNIENENNITDDNIDELLQVYNIQDDDLMIVNNDGSYVIVPMDLAEQLMSNEDFVHKIDVGFDNIQEFQDFVKNTFETINNIN